MELHLSSFKLLKWHDASVTQGLPCSPMARLAPQWLTEMSQ